MPTCQNIAPITLSMAPYTGPWTKDLASHLLRRTLFGPTQVQINDTVALGVDFAVENLLQIIPSTDPLTWHPDEAVGAQGATWVTEFYPTDEALVDPTEDARKHSLFSWIAGRINTEQNASPSITEKICFFWHNHFSAKRTGDGRNTFMYHRLLDTHALGNFRTLIEDITVDPCMMYFLDTASNTKWSPNENYARELLELYTIGKGPLIGPGDYSNYTEEDIAAGAMILTGWKVRENKSAVANPYSEFDPSHHEDSDKQLSHHFNNAIVTSNDELEYKDFIDLIFQKDETAFHISKKLYRFFVSTEITPEIESSVIDQMAQTMLANNYEIRPVLAELLKSEHFYDLVNIGAHMKSPLEFIFSMMNPTLTYPTNGLDGDNLLWKQLYAKASSINQNWYTPPSVAGWPCFYQEPAFMQHWLNAATINSRFWYVTQLTTHSTGISSDTFGTLYSIKIDALSFLATLQTPSDGTAMIDEICLLFLPRLLEQTKMDALLNTLTDGLPEFEWTLQYNEYLANPADVNYSDPVKSQMEAVLSQLFKSPEFQSC